jgi:hypothetical protein
LVHFEPTWISSSPFIREILRGRKYGGGLLRGIRQEESLLTSGVPIGIDNGIVIIIHW